MYFITSQDPNYTIKGSRDPLGLQEIWQEAGRKLIPDLSTVSNNITDFQILGLACAIRNELKILKDKDFEQFFMQFEQLMAYTRYIANPKASFNGIDKVRKIMELQPRTVRISTNAADQILSNQKAYGIWGKYIRPFRDMKISAYTNEICELSTSTTLDELYGESILNYESLLNVAKRIKQKASTSSSYVEYEKLEEWGELLKKPKGREKIYYKEKLLTDKCDNSISFALENNSDLSDIIKEEEFNETSLYKFIERLKGVSSNIKFINILDFIKNTERVISPLNRIFKYIQTKSFWKYDELGKDEFITKWKIKHDRTGFEETSILLSDAISQENTELVKALIKRNEDVTGRRHSTAWMTANEEGIEVNHFDGLYFDKKYNPQINNDFNYFLRSFCSLYKQLD